jgi:Mpv17 / PMP22 family
VQAFLSKSVSGILSIAGKVGIDQLCYSPLCTMVFFTWCNAATFTPEKIPRDISQKLVSCTTASWSLWGPMMAINMALVPAQLRMLFVNVISLFWTYKLSTMSAAPSCDAQILELSSAAPACDAQILELTQQETAPAGDCTAVCVAEILGHMSEEEFAVCAGCCTTFVELLDGVSACLVHQECAILLL